MRPDIEAYWAEAAKPPTMDDDILRLALEHFPYMRGDTYGGAFTPVSMSSPELGQHLLNFAHAVRALPTTQEATDA